MSGKRLELPLLETTQNACNMLLVMNIKLKAVRVLSAKKTQDHVSGIEDKASGRVVLKNKISVRSMHLFDKLSCEQFLLHLTRSNGYFLFKRIRHIYYLPSEFHALSEPWIQVLHSKFVKKEDNHELLVNLNCTCIMFHAADTSR